MALSPPITPQQLSIRILAHIIYLFLSNKVVKTGICTWLHNRFASCLAAAIILVNDYFPRTSMEERMVDGPFVQFLKNIEKPIVINLDNTVTAQYQEVLTTLDHLRKGK